MSFGELVMHYLARQERTAAWLAERLKVSPSTVTRWLNEESKPKDLQTVVRVADLLRVHTPDERRQLLAAAGFAYFEAPHTEDEVELQPPGEQALPPAEHPPPAHLPPTNPHPEGVQGGRPDPPVPMRGILLRLQEWLHWSEAPIEARISWAGMTVYSLQRLTNVQMARRIQAVLVAIALWLATGWLLEPVLSKSLNNLSDRLPATLYFALASLVIPPFVALATQPDLHEAYAPQTLRQQLLLWFLKVQGAYVGFDDFAGIVVGVAFLSRQLLGHGLTPGFCWLVAILPLLFSHIGARRIPYDRFCLYQELRANPADRYFLPVYIGFGPLLALFIYLAYPLLTHPLIGFTTLVGLILLIWWELRFARP